MFWKLKISLSYKTNVEVQKINQSVTKLEMDVNKNHSKKIFLFSQFFVESFGA